MIFVTMNYGCMIYRLSPSIMVRQTEKWSKEKNSFDMIQDFSSGHIDIDTNDYENFDLKKPPKIFHSIIDIDLSDNDGVEFKSKNTKIEKIQEIFDEGFEAALEENGWERDPDSVEYEFIGDIDFEIVDNNKTQDE
tara:strand:- start:500 stop:907 length:408 start_codon:yes stop_codon:yes gene_type:complete